MKKLHVLYIITKLELGGAQKVCLSLLKGIKKSGNSATLISGDTGILLDETKQHSDVILLKNFKREVSIFSIFNEFKNFCQLVKQIKQIKKKHPNLIVHTHSTKAGIIGRWAAFFANVKIRIHTVHGFAFHSHQNKITWCLIYLCELLTSLITSHFVCVSSHDIKTGNELLPYFTKKYSIIRAAIDWQKFIAAKKTYLNTFIAQSIKPELNNQPNEFIFGTVACFKKQKNLIDLFKAFEFLNIKNPNCKLEVIGDGILRNELESWIEIHGLKDKIILLGWQKNVVEFMSTWNAFVLSSLWEGLPCAIIEARLLKLPVICYNTGGIKDVIIDGKNGFLINQLDWESLSKAMLKITNNSNLYTNLKFYKEDLSDFNDKKMVKQHIKLYQKLLL